ncbi:Glycosyl transferase family 2 [Flavobacterium columnare]|uniref:Glycosyltransferase family A protein n=2 Tax=Flavobacterium TaxID=237 RepID=A0ABW8PQR9_9FLAO|nr:glycosyltransferase family A protein [Flavobacterium columnare]SPE78549.1 Glycosyl transferase family 2 [Flavobacterium columnare]
MIVLVHDFHKVKKIEGVSEVEYKIIIQEESIAKSICLLASNYPSEVIVWCNESYYSKLNRAFIENAFPHNRYMYSYNPMGNFFSGAIGYVEESPFININKQVCYPTWQMSSVVGAMQSSTILLLSKSCWGISNNLDYVLNTVAKLYQPLGLFCYSEPMLLVDSRFQIAYPKATSKELFSFVAQQYKWVWKHFLLFCFFIFEKRFCFLSWLLSLFQRQLECQKETIVFEEPQKTIDWELETIDVIIPTIGRKKYLYDVLKDLSGQTHLPKNVIIVEQNPNPDSNSELDYLTTEQWPFQIKHVFIHQTGACQARNIALNKVESEWCFLADDDIRIEPAFLKEGLTNINQLDVGAAVFNCFQKDEVHFYTKIAQTTIFGSGCSIFNREKYKHAYFDEKLEFGFGEDIEYGMQLRNGGCNVVYLPEPTILHLKAPIGGFRTKFQYPWANDKIKPKPSPTIMYVKKKYLSKKQILGYRTVLFLKTHSFNLLKINDFKKGWEQSIHWMNKL